MKNIPFDSPIRKYLPREVQLERTRKILQQELTSLQRQAIMDYYFQGKSLSQIARERNVNKSTVCRTLRRAEAKLKRFLQY